MSQSSTSESPTRSHPLWNLVVARLREFIREPAAIFWVYVFPLVMVVALGVAFRNRPVERFTVVIQQGPAADAVRSSLAEHDKFDTQVLEAAAARNRLRTGKADLLIVPGLPSQPEVEYYFDPTRSAAILARDAVDDVLQRASGRMDVVASRNHEVTEPGGRYIDFLVPGLLGMGLLGGGLWGVGFAVVDLRIRKLLKRYLATPMKRGQFLAALMISRLIFAIPEILILLLFSRIFFGVSVQGSYLVLGLLILMGAFQFSGIGLLVASRAQTVETVSGLMNLVMLPLWIASGIFFSTERFPDAVQPVIAILPLTPLINSMRAVMLEGAGPATLGTELALILAWTVVPFALALRWFRWN